MTFTALRAPSRGALRSPSTGKRASLVDIMSVMLFESVVGVICPTSQRRMWRWLEGSQEECAPFLSANPQ